MPMSQSWARDAVIYQVYPRSFADANGDGIGDLPGITSRLDYLVELGVDAIWLSPFYKSPMADAGYDVADYRDVDPIFGTLADFDALLAGAHQRNLKVIIDLVPNHTSDQHPWFQEALAAGPGSPARQRYLFRDGAGPDGSEPPNDWQSVFGGPAWTRVPDGQWYLHLFAPEQPDLDWEHPQVRAEFADIIRFWLDRGADGLRIDVAHGMVKAPGLPGMAAASAEMFGGAHTPYWDQEGVHEIYREWRKILDGYTPERIAVAEAWVPTLDRLSRYVRRDELHQAFNFQFLRTPWSASAYREVIIASIAAVESVGATATWVLSNHDVVRHATRLGRVNPEHTGGVAGGAHRGEEPADPVLGLARARAATLMMLALPGSAYLYQGEELGLPEVLDLPDELRQDPRFHQTGGEILGRDGCRVPIPWSGTEPPFGFGPPGSKPWLPQPADWARLTVEVQRRDPDSTWSLYRNALRLRRELALGSGHLSWPEPPADDVVLFERPGLICTTNCGSDPVRLPRRYGEPVLASGPVPEPGVLPANTTVWWRTSG
ncbi:MAG TPA: alpha-amylase family glycosyl hydrolase [Natronosporangium sp.]